MQIGTQIKPVLTSSLSPQSMLRGLESGWRPLRRLCDVGERCRSRRKRRRWSRGHAGRRVSEFAKANAAASETTASDRRARGGGEIDTLAEASGAVLAAKWGEAAEEHGGDVFGWWCVVCGQRWRFRVWVVRWREWGNHPRVN